ncbi:MAG: hypothetical protein H6581_24645 [Bacteroidia bacterium]|nr:hypothetical protein [Bacteroidia bacterium]
MSKHQIQINKIDCKGTSESGHDEVYIIAQADGGLPIRYPSELGSYNSMKDGDSWTLSNPNLILDFDYEVLVTLWDQDVKYLPSVATFLVNMDFTPHAAGAYKETLDNHNGAKYELKFTYIK